MNNYHEGLSAMCPWDKKLTVFGLFRIAPSKRRAEEKKKGVYRNLQTHSECVRVRDADVLIRDRITMKMGDQETR